MRFYRPIRSEYWIIRDADDDRIERLAFHIERGDYFPFLATIIGMLAETVATEGASSEAAKEQAAFADEVRKDLLYLHERYVIMPRTKKLVYTNEKVVRFRTHGVS